MELFDSLLFDFEPSEKMPGFSPKCSSALFPFWGEYRFIDFALLNTDFPSCGRRLIFCRKENIRQLSSYSIKWKQYAPELHPLELDISAFMEIIKSSQAEHFLLYNIAFLAILNPVDIERVKGNGKNRLLKFTVEEIPADIYFIDKKKLISMIEDSRSLISSRELFTKDLFSKILLPFFDKMENIEGKVLFQNSILQLYRENLNIISKSISSAFTNRIKSIGITSDKESIISQKGWVKNSVISSNTRIDGYVENSVIFPGVHIKEDSHVINSVVMNQNQIGKKVRIKNTLLFPFTGDNISSHTVGENSVIGSLSSSSVNSDYPEQIKDGLTVIGMNPNIPDNTVIESGCLVGPDVSSAMFKNRKKLRKGSSLYGNYKM